MAHVYRRKDRNGKPYKVWRYRFKDERGQWQDRRGWEDKDRTKHHALERINALMDGFTIAWGQIK